MHCASFPHCFHSLCEDRGDANDIKNINKKSGFGGRFETALEDWSNWERKGKGEILGGESHSPSGHRNVHPNF
jgi:hypothetical protein